MKITIDDKKVIFSYSNESFSLTIGETLNESRIVNLARFLLGFLSFSLSWNDSPERMGR